MSKDKKKNKKFKLDNGSVAVIMTPITKTDNTDLMFSFAMNQSDNSISESTLQFLSHTALIMTAAFRLAMRDPDFYQELVEEIIDMQTPEQKTAKDRVIKSEDNVITLDFSTPTKGNA